MEQDTQRNVFSRRTFLKYGVYSIGGEGGAVGPDLSDVAGRLDQDAIAAYLADPNAMIPKSLHPKLQFTEEEIQALTAYLGTLGAQVEYSAEAPALFDQECGSCHTVDGSGGTLGPDLSRVGSFRDPGYLEVFIKNPQSVAAGSTMPAFQDRLSAVEIHDLAAYLSTFKGQTPPGPGGSTAKEPSEAGSAEDLFTSFCAACHSSIPGGGLTRAEAEAVVRDGREGMPAFKDRLTSEQIGVLAEYLVSSP